MAGRQRECSGGEAGVGADRVAEAGVGAFLLALVLAANDLAQGLA